MSILSVFVFLFFVLGILYLSSNTLATTAQNNSNALNKTQPVTAPTITPTTAQNNSNALNKTQPVTAPTITPTTAQNNSNALNKTQPVTAPTITPTTAQNNSNALNKTQPVTAPTITPTTAQNNSNPDTQITRLVNGRGESLASGGTTDSNSAQFFFRRIPIANTSLPVTSFQCNLDDAKFVPCVSSAASAFGLSDGLHIFRVRAVDRDGRIDNTPAEFRWFIRTGPNIEGNLTNTAPKPVPTQNIPECIQVYQTKTELCYPHSWVKTKLIYGGLSKNVRSNANLEFDLVLSPCNEIYPSSPNGTLSCLKRGINDTINLPVRPGDIVAPTSRLALDDAIYYNRMPNVYVEFKVVSFANSSQPGTLKKLVADNIAQIMKNGTARIIEFAPSTAQGLNGFRLSYVTQPSSKDNKSLNYSRYNTEITYSLDDRVYPLSKIYQLSYEVPASKQFYYLPKINSIISSFRPLG